MIVVGVRRTEQRDQAVSALLADDAAIAPHRTAHGIEGRLQARNGGFGIELRDQMAPGPVHDDQLRDTRLLLHPLV